MRLVDCVGVVVAELVDDLRYPVVVLRLEGIANETFELECAAFALVVELIAKRFGDVGVHSDSVRQLPLHGAAMDSLWSTRGGRRVREWPLAGAVVVASACMLRQSSHAGTDVDVPLQEPSLPPTRQVQGQQPLRDSDGRTHNFVEGANFGKQEPHLSLICAMTPKSYRIYTQPSPS